MLRRKPGYTRTNTLVPYTTLFRYEAANTERPFGCCDGVELGFVSIEESVPPEARLDSLERSPHPRILGIAITEARHEEQRGIHAVSIQLTDVGGQVAIEPPRLDRFRDGRTLLFEPVSRDAQALNWIDLEQAVESDPAHQLGKGIVALAIPDFPDAMIRLPPLVADHSDRQSAV